MLETLIREEIAHYLAGDISVEELEHRLPDGWALDEANDPKARELTFRVMGHLSEHMAGDISDEELRRRLSAYAGWVTTKVYSSAAGETVTPRRAPEVEQRRPRPARTPPKIA